MALPTGVALVVAPHQDDETFACGGLIAMKRQAGFPVSVVFVTDGRASHSPDCLSSETLAKRRKQEAIDATTILGVPKGDVYFLDGPDGLLPVLSNSDSDRLTARLAEVIQRTAATEIYAPHRGDRHPDHEATYRLTLRAIERSAAAVSVFEYPVWLLWRRPVPSLPLGEASGAGRLEFTQEISQIKNRAIEVYATQLPGMPPGFMRQFRRLEEFFFGPQRVSFGVEMSESAKRPANQSILAPTRNTDFENVRPIDAA
jgi:LmbE family N-acetylglucosaminyl deacetylase